MSSRRVPAGTGRRIVATAAALLALGGSGVWTLVGPSAFASPSARVPLWSSLTSSSTLQGGRVNVHGGVRQPSGCMRTVVVQRHVSGTWHSFRSAPATRNGYFSLPVPTSTPGRFAFRVVAPARCRMPVAYAAAQTLLVKPPPVPSGPTATVSLGGAVPAAARFLPTSLGLSIEKGAMVGSAYAAADAGMVNLFRLLGASVLRIGGNTVNTTTWNSAGPGSTSGNITPSDVDRLAGFIRATGWKVIYGVNFATETPAQMASEIAYAQQALGANLIGVELGNEPDLYSTNGLRSSTYTYSDFLGEWKTDAAAIRAAVPAAVLIGPASSWNYKGYTDPFAASQGSSLGVLTQHFYIGASTPDPSTGYNPTIGYLLAHPGDPTMFRAIAAAAAANHITGGARLAEANSFYTSGEPGVSDAFASALWVADLIFTANASGLTGVNIHSGGGATYAPIKTTSTGVMSVQPGYFGLLLAARAASFGSTLHATAVTAPNGAVLKAYAVEGTAGSEAVVLLNESTLDLSVTLTNLTVSATSAKVSTVRAPSLGDTTPADTTMNGGSLDVSGTWSSPPNPAPTGVTTGRATVVAPAGSAVLLTIG